MILVDAAPDNEWAIEAACRGHDNTLFFPSADMKMPVTEKRADVKRALGICGSCSVKSECLTYALEWEPWGVWGGTTERQRERMRRERKIVLKRVISR